MDQSEDKVASKIDIDKVSRKFESFLRHQLPQLLNLSISKQIAFERIFYHYSDNFKRLAKECPEEASEFANEFMDKIKRIEKWRRPRGTDITPIIHNEKFFQQPNGGIKYKLVGKKLYKKD
jgi:ribosomal protein L32E